MLSNRQQLTPSDEQIGENVIGSEKLTPGGNMKLTHPTEWFLNGGGTDAEGGGSDGVGGIAQAWSEIRRLEKELARAQMERDILKKAIGIFSGPPK